MNPPSVRQTWHSVWNRDRSGRLSIRSSDIEISALIYKCWLFPADSFACKGGTNDNRHRPFSRSLGNCHSPFEVLSQRDWGCQVYPWIWHRNDGGHLPISCCWPVAGLGWRVFVPNRTHACADRSWRSLSCCWWNPVLPPPVRWNLSVLQWDCSVLSLIRYLQRLFCWLAASHRCSLACPTVVGRWLFPVGWPWDYRNTMCCLVAVCSLFAGDCCQHCWCLCHCWLLVLSAILAPPVGYAPLFLSFSVHL